MIIEEIRKNAPKLATHYKPDKNGVIVYFWVYSKDIDGVDGMSFWYKGYWQQMSIILDDLLELW